MAGDLDSLSNDLRQEETPASRARTAALLRKLADQYEDPEAKIGAMLIAVMDQEAFTLMVGVTPGMSPQELVVYAERVSAALSAVLSSSHGELPAAEPRMVPGGQA